jgi:hypothetical protein
MMKTMMHFKPVFTTKHKLHKSHAKSQQLHCTPSSGERRENTELARVRMYKQDMDLSGVEIYGFFPDVI